MEERAPSVTVGICVLPPFVMKHRDHYDGFDIELWEETAKEAGIHYHYKVLEFKDLIPVLLRKEIDVIVATLTMTVERQKILNFSHATLKSGLGILVRGDRRYSIFNALRMFYNRSIVDIYVFVLFFTILSAHVIWFLERHGGGTLSGPYIPGIFNAYWWAVVTIATIGYGDYTPVTFWGRFAALFVIVIGLTAFGAYIAQLSSLLTLRTLRTDIADEEDLRGKRVATVAGTTSESVLHELGARAETFPNVEGAYRALQDKKVEAVVFNAPILKHYAETKGRGKVALVDMSFETQLYGFGVRQDEKELLTKINQSLLKVYNSGKYQEIQQRWFGTMM